MAGRGFRGSDGAFQSKAALEAFTEAMNKGATEAEANSAAQAAQNTIVRDGTKAKKAETKASKGFVASLKKAAAVATVGRLAQGGVRAALTTNATFGQGFTDTLTGFVSGATGAMQLERQAIGRAQQRTDEFFGDAVRFGGHEPTKAEIGTMFERFKAEEFRPIETKREIGALGIDARNQVAGQAVGPALDVMLGVQQEIRDLLRSLSGG